MAVDRESGGDRTDDILADAVRNGDREAFGDLYVRYSLVAHRFACRLLGSAQGADDVVSESFAKVLNRLLSGGGPTTAFRSYLLTTVRTTLYKQLAADRMVDRQVELSEPAGPQTDPLMDQLDAGFAARAFQTLSQRWQSVLWQLEVEDKSTAAVATLLGIHPNAVAALVFRARDALRVAYLQMHVNTDVSDGCRESAVHLAAWLCGRLHRAQRTRVGQHLDCCDRCTCAAVELSELVTQLRRWVPLMVSQPADSILVRKTA
ncbi:MAG TPA: sigma-70 family RNA polymerase sigma factor [Pseudonocardiaceae bacterium]|nr:sigma-70 family RNA polymerase sigma factor [Pseudonocardiaceae bacterium]